METIFEFLWIIVACAIVTSGGGVLTWVLMAAIYQHLGKTRTWKDSALYFTLGAVIAFSLIFYPSALTIIVTGRSTYQTSFQETVETDIAQYYPWYGSAVVYKAADKPITEDVAIYRVAISQRRADGTWSFSMAYCLKADMHRGQLGVISYPVGSSTPFFIPHPQLVKE